MRLQSGRRKMGILASEYDTRQHPQSKRGLKSAHRRMTRIIVETSNVVCVVLHGLRYLPSTLR